MAKGLVKWWNSTKGFGFVTGEDGKDVFAHYTAIEQNGGRRDLQEGEAVEFQVIQTEKGPKAANIARVSA